MKLYEITKTWKELAALEDMPPEAISDTLEALEGDVQEKAQAIVAVTTNMSSEIEAIDSEIKRLMDRKTAIENQKKSVVAYLKHHMTAMQITNIRCPLFSITLAKAPPVAVIEDESLLPDEYMTVKTTIRPDKRAILADLKAKIDIPGAHLGRGEPSVRIK